MIECPLARSARLHPDAPALRFGASTWNYAQLDDEVRRWHGALLRAGVREGDRVVVRSPNRPEVVALLLACARAEIPPLLARLSPRVKLGELPDGVPLSDFATSAVPVANHPLDGQAVHTVLFTSGTTGTPKAAQLQFRAHYANAIASNEVLRIEAGSRYLACLPLHHVGGIAIGMRCVVAGAEMILHPRFDADACARDLEEGATHASFVANMLARVLDTGRRFPAAIVLVGGGAAPRDLLARARAAGLEVLHTYGLTESASQVTCELPGEADGSSAGMPLPGTEVVIGANGEIEVRGRTLMLGYLGEPPIGEWLRTGDLGEIDPRGRLIVHARRTDLIVSGGENVYPAEVEAALLAHPAVADVAVVPWPDKALGQVGYAAVVTRAPVAEGDLDLHVRDRLAGFKAPRRYVFLEALPRGESGKVDRRGLLGTLQAL
ncbi:MAG: 2-succinylbenzoate--CoA ligase [Deltaproteobacteria bacterium]|nr:MAG: 2-succinylbenzoate--CoA ligase [Deltaproteobacteria bacterium]